MQSVTGFGFAVLSAPVLAAVTDGPTAVSTVLITGTIADVLILLARRKRPISDWGEVGVVGASSLPGIAVGTMLLVVAPKNVLMVIIALCVLTAVAHRWWLGRRRTMTQRRTGRSWGVLAGMLSGTFGAATTLAGPPTVLYLGYRDLSPGRMRDTLVTLNLVRLPVSLAALLWAGTFTVIPGIFWLVVGVLAGYAMGGRLFRRIRPGQYNAITRAVLLRAAVVALVSAITANAR